MISTTISLYISAGLVIGLLAAFSVHNRKTGWKKTRTSLAESLDDFYMDLGLGEVDREPVHSAVLSDSKPAEAFDPSNFTLQLISLRKALGESAQVTVDREPENRTETNDARETSLVPVRKQ